MTHNHAIQDGSGSKKESFLREMGYKVLITPINGDYCEPEEWRKPFFGKIGL